MKKQIFPLVLFIIGLIVVVFPHIAQRVTKEIHEHQVEAIQQQIQQMPEEKVKEVTNHVKNCNEVIYKNEDGINDPFTDYFDLNYYDECTDIIEKSDYPLALEVPKLDLNIPIFIGTSEENLRQGIGQVEGSSLPTGGRKFPYCFSGSSWHGNKSDVPAFRSFASWGYILYSYG